MADSDNFKRHHGRETQSMPRGDRLVTDYGKDTSGYVGSRSDERIKKLGGSVDNLDHSLKGASARQRISE